ncbi:MAG: type II secretion system F family protein [Bryobacteraceae bacterium]
MSAVVLVMVFLGVFVAATGAVVASKFLLDRLPEGEPTSVVDVETWGDIVDSPLLKEERLSTISFWHRMLQRFDWVENMKTRIAEAGLSWSVGRLTAMMLLAGTATLALTNQISWLPRYVVLGSAATAVAAPYMVVLRRRNRRLRLFEEQFPDALDSLARSLRAGNPLLAALDVLARECPAPLSVEMRRTVDERALGGNWDQALAHLSQRVPIVEVSLFAAAVQLQSRTGGRLHEVLGRLSENMREASALKGEVQSVAAHGRMTGKVLTCLPVAIAFVMIFTSPSHLEVLWRHPSGPDLITAALACLVLAHLVIKKLVDIRL